MVTTSDLLQYVPDKQYSARYLGPGLQRVAAYHRQAAYALRSAPRNALVVGKGDGIVIDLLQHAGVNVVSLDIAVPVHPTVRGSIHALPFAPASFDVALCCEVLEHLPLNLFVPSLRELRRVTRGNLVLSVPDTRRLLSIALRTPRIRNFQIAFTWQHSFPVHKDRKMPNEKLELMGHYWEIGYEGVTFKTVRRDLATAGWRFLETWRPAEIEWPESFFYCQAEGTSPR